MFDRRLYCSMLADEYKNAAAKGVESVPLSRVPFSRGSPKHLYMLELLHRYAPVPCNYLDVSIGDGFVARVLARNGFQVCGVDHGQIQESLNVAYEGTGIRICDVNIEDKPLPFGDSIFDAAYWGSTIEHLPNSPRHAVGEIRRVLKPGGVLIVDTPNLVNIKRRLQLLLGKSIMPSIEYIYNCSINTEHHREYTLDELVKVMVWSDLEVLHSSHVDTFFPLSMKRFGKLYSDRVSPADRTSFDVGFDWLNWYDWAKIPFWLMVKIVPSLREFLFVVCRKSISE